MRSHFVSLPHRDTRHQAFSILIIIIILMDLPQEPERDGVEAGSRVGSRNQSAGRPGEGMPHGWRLRCHDPVDTDGRRWQRGWDLVR
jgi:hypothetical protein